ncbi:ATP-dependent helicase/nuclease subunit B [Halarchaeum rubridurum]|uniref:ATP-dependent helicase/nuclease subunit B n=1 Tax=Halarchaeum rubridurum TaxID=489911 RepID=A0A830FMG6_9EURY|nr:hypothetical protein [Halarchaeum rubridurum]MBP1953525.1 ATP-dependent helicase/nuclease subunit B [Halarchaeum rubridurum]GGM64572.1 hypothetical protein GCM10009017_13340 [Halarchaeum rubridurum]
MTDADSGFPGSRDDRTASLTVHVGEPEELLDRATRRAGATDLVLTPERLHRRNLKRALAERSRPRSSLRLVSPGDVAGAVAPRAADRGALDRADRLRLLERVLDDESVASDPLRTIFGGELAAHVERVEAAREELTTVAGGTSARRDALEAVADALPPTAARETRALLDGLDGIDAALAERASRAVSTAAALHAAREAVTRSDGAAWTDAYSGIERVSLAGVSTVGSPLLDLLGAVAAHTDTDVRLFLRAGTGPRVAERLASRLTAGPAVDAADVTVAETTTGRLEPDVPVAEIVAPTRREEARAAMAAVDALLERGVALADVAVVARDVDRYERALTRAAGEYGRHLSVWTQLAVGETRPYRVLDACATLLAAAENGDDGERGTAGDIAPAALFAPFDAEWVPPDADPGGVWPLDHGDVAAVRRALADEAGTVEAWRRRLDAFEPGGDGEAVARAGVRRLLAWVETHASTPRPADVEATLRPLLDAHERVVLPAVLDADGPGLGATSRNARALSRSRKLLDEAPAKYGDWRERGHVEASWEAVADVLDAVVTTRPGRREHDNAERIDVLDATDAWLRSMPYVVAVGFVDGEWPERPRGAFPPAFRDAVVAGDGGPRGGAALGVRGAWTEARERDHLADAVGAASAGLVCTRFTTDAGGVTAHRSPFLDAVAPDAPTIEGDDLAALLAADRRVPDALADVLGGSAEGER